MKNDIVHSAWDCVFHWFAVSKTNTWQNVNQEAFKRNNKTSEAFLFRCVDVLQKMHVFWETEKRNEYSKYVCCFLSCFEFTKCIYLFGIF